MHIPDGFLSVPVSLACAVLSASAIGFAAIRARARSGSRAVAMLGVTAAFVFAAQMLNFPVAGGTSGHLIGGVLAAVLLGPAAAVIVMTAVLVMQCFVFGDGGLLSLGANALNMGVVHPLVGFAVYRLLVRPRASASPPGDARAIAGIAFASWVATVVAAVTCAGELALSHVVAPAVVLPAMLWVHVVIGLGEATIAAFVLATVIRLRPELLADPKRAGRHGGHASVIVLGLIASLALALFVSPFACQWPDGLERVVERLGIEPAYARVSLSAPFGGYAIPGFARSRVTTALVALLGTMLVFALSCGLGFWLAPRRQGRQASGSTPALRS